MRKNVFGRQFKRDSDERKALFKNLISELILHERIQTTEQKAKAIKPSVERLVTKTKQKGVNARMFLLPEMTHEAVDKLITDVAPRFSERNGGYTRIIRLQRRLSDNAMMVYLEWVEKAKAIVADGGKKQKKDKVASTSEMQVTQPVEAKKSTRSKAKPKRTSKKEITK